MRKPHTETTRLELLGESNQEIQFDFPSPIKPKTRRDVYILVANDRNLFKWPTARNRKKTVTWTVLKFLTRYCSVNGTPRHIVPTTLAVLKVKSFLRR